jgi:sulfide:quinone oxidoreductase
VRQGEVTAIDPAAKAAKVEGEQIAADVLLVALGAAHAPQAIDGLVEHGINIYARDEAERARDALASTSKGHIVIGIFGAPYTCPPAPFELALLANDAARDRRAKNTFEIVSPLPSSLPVLDRAGCEAIEGRLTGQMIGFRPNTKAARVEPGAIVTEADERIAFDLLLAVPPHRPPKPILDAGLAQPGGWIPVAPHTLATTIEGVWAVGDCIGIPLGNGKPLPKAGELAAGQGVVAAEHMAAHLAGAPSDATYWGDGRCFLEVGGGEAMVIEGRFLAEAGPEVRLAPPSADHLAEKTAFECERLEAWFG